MPNRLFRIVSSLLVIGVLLNACGGPAAQAPKTPLKVAWSLWPGYYPIAIAKEKGFFDKHGLQVEPIFYPIYANQLPDLASGMVDGAVTTLSDTMFDSISSTVKVVMVLDNSVGADQVVASSAISGPQDVRGKRIGVSKATVSGGLLIRQMLDKNGILPSEVTFVEVFPEDVPNALQKNTIDLGYTYDPFTSEALAQGGKIIFSSADAPGVIVDVLSFRLEITRNRPEDVKAFIDAWFEAQQYWRDNPADGNAIIAKATGLKPEEVSSIGVNLFDRDANLKTFKPGITADYVYFTAQQTVKFLVESGDLTNPVHINDLLDPSFLR